ncbi:MAG TPA: hypothetical protein PLQ56_28215 [Aggregatilineales bacterium]|nr:hypothetical protein [Aggregatilineales bacterium]
MTDLMPLLMEAFHFTADDLAANRDGKVTQSQLERFEFVKRNDFSVILVYTLSFLPCFLCISVASPRAGSPGVVYAVLLVVMLVVGWFLTQRLIQKESSDLVLTQYEGVVELVLQRNKSLKSHMLHIMGTYPEYFYISPKQYEQLKDVLQQETVRLKVYALKHSQHIISAEVLWPTNTQIG